MVPSNKPVVPAQPPEPLHPATHNVFESADLLTRLLIHQADLGYRLATFYTASTTAYVAFVAVTAQYYFSFLPGDRAAAFRVAVFGFAVAIFAITAPFGLELSRRQIAAAAKTYAEALGLPAETFTVVRFGAALSFVAFSAIAVAWMFLIGRAL